MVICRRPLILVTDLVGLLIVAGLTAGVSAMVILPNMAARNELPGLREDLALAQRKEHKLAARNKALTHSVERLAASLREQSQQPLADAGTFLRHMSEQCARYDIELRAVRPLATVRGEAFSSWDVQVEARGAFPEFCRLLYGIESWSPYLHVSNINVQAPRQSDGTICQLSWTVRVNYLPEWPRAGSQP